MCGTDSIGLIDPWFDRAGAYLGSWHQFPDNRHLLSRDLLTPDWIAITTDGEDRCDIATLSLMPPGTVVFVAAGHRSVTARLMKTRLRIIEVPPSVPMRLDSGGSELVFIVHGPDATASSVLLRVDDASLFVCAPARNAHARLDDVSPGGGEPLDLLLVPVARASADPLCLELGAQAAQRRATELRERAIDGACDLALTSNARVVVPYGGPPCFLDPALWSLNDALGPDGVLPDVERAAGLLQARLPGRYITSLLPGDRLFPAERLVMNDSHWRNFSFDERARYLHDYAFARAVDLSNLYAHFLAPAESVGPAFKSALESLPVADDVEERVRFEVTGRGGGDWDVIVDHSAIRVDLRPRTSAPDETIRIASNWLAAVIDGRVTWPVLFRSLRYSLASTTGSYESPLLALLERAGESGPVPGTTPSL